MKGIFDELSAVIAHVVVNAKAEKVAWKKSAHARRASRRLELGLGGIAGAEAEVTVMEIEEQHSDERVAEVAVDAVTSDSVGQGVSSVMSRGLGLMQGQQGLAPGLGPLSGPGPALGPGIKTLTRQGSPTEQNHTPSKRARLGKNNNHINLNNGGHVDGLAMDSSTLGESGQVVGGQELEMGEDGDAAVMSDDVDNDDEDVIVAERLVYYCNNYPTTTLTFALTLQPLLPHHHLLPTLRYPHIPPLSPLPASSCHADALAALLTRLLVVDHPIATKNPPTTGATIDDNVTTSGGGSDSTAMVVSCSDSLSCLDTSSSSSPPSSSTPIDTTFQLLYAPDKDVRCSFAGLVLQVRSQYTHHITSHPNCDFFSL